MRIMLDTNIFISMIFFPSAQTRELARRLTESHEWNARDAIRKIQAVFKSRMQDGKRISPNIPYGYLRSREDKQKLKKIFRMPSYNRPLPSK